MLTPKEVLGIIIVLIFTTLLIIGMFITKYWDVMAGGIR
jgi:hypothetical protein